MQTVKAKEYHEIVQVSDPQLSPDGETVAFVRKEPVEDEYETTVYVVSVDGDRMRQFTAKEGIDANPRWSPNGDHLAFTSIRGDSDTSQLWVLPVDGGEARQLTDVVGGVETFVWSPDGNRIAFTQNSIDDEREVGLDRDTSVNKEYNREPPDPKVIDRMVYRAQEQYFDGTRSHVYTVELENELVMRHTAGNYDFVAPEFGDATTLYYAVCRDTPTDDSTRYDIDSVDLESGEVETITQTTSWAPSIAATEDGYLAYPRTPEPRASMQQTDVEVCDPTGEQTVITADLDRTVEPQSIQWAGDDLYFLTPDTGNVVLRRAVLEATNDPERDLETDSSIVVKDGELTGVSVEGDTIAFIKSEWDHPGDVFALVDGDVRRLTTVNADYLDSHHIGQPEAIWFENDGREIQGWLLTPPEADIDRSEQYPLVVEIHGGPHGMWSTSGTMWHEFQTLAARGYAVFWCNPRGSVGYGDSFATAIERDWGQVTMNDVLAGTDRVAEREYIDTDNQFVTGGSFGGYMTAWIVAHTDRFSGAVAQRGVYDLASFYGSTDAFKLIEGDFDALPWEDSEFLWKHSPAAHATHVETPTLIIHSDNDFRVPVNNAELLHLFYRKLGVETRLVRYPREGHELSRSGEPNHIVDRLERIVRWFDGYSDYHDVPKALERGSDGLSNDNRGERRGNERPV
ncbi:S9 family peptidase [Halocatena marina]|uniref:Prolyl oligopeptidase family serine peptidase n=1 Tax=Halocatena marina TaxID=2934937 RepID=A0ABD5YQ64_9EURY|nr:S9 family peptidase [Halocatena marina]